MFKNPKIMPRMNVIGTVLAALCCFTPILIPAMHHKTGSYDGLSRPSAAFRAGRIHRSDRPCTMVKKAILHLR